jgi:hypothetical protein
MALNVVGDSAGELFEIPLYQQRVIFLTDGQCCRETQMQTRKYDDMICETNEEENNGKILTKIWTKKCFKYGWNYFSVRASLADASKTEQWPTLLLLVTHIRGDIG